MITIAEIRKTINSDIVELLLLFSISCRWHSQWSQKIAVTQYVAGHRSPKYSLGLFLSKQQANLPWYFYITRDILLQFLQWDNLHTIHYYKFASVFLYIRYFYSFVVGWESCWRLLLLLNTRLVNFLKHKVLNFWWNKLILEHVTCWIVSLGVWCWSCITGIFLGRWGHCLRPLLNMHRCRAGLQSISYFCWEPLQHRKWNTFVWKSWCLHLTWEHSKGVLPCSGRKRSPIGTFQWKSILVVRWWWQVGIRR